MSFELKAIDAAAEAILLKIKNGELGEACCMSAVNSPIAESWEIAGQLAENTVLSKSQQERILDALNPQIREHLKSTGFDDFDLIYERLLQLIAPN
jgi:mannose-6-phosphate isomerase class I